MLATILAVATFGLLGGALLSYNVKFGYAKIVQGLKEGGEYRGFFTELFAQRENIFDNFLYGIPFYIDKTEDEQINKFVDKHNFCLNLFFILMVLFVILMTVIVLVNGNKKIPFE